MYFFKKLSGALSLTLVITVCFFSANNALARSAPESFADLAQKLLPAVVNISTTAVNKKATGKTPEMPQFPPGSPFEEFFKEFFDKNRPEQQRKSTSLGSGFIIDKKGIIITNNHVIQDADEINVILQDNKVLKATVVGRDSKTDLAVLSVKTSEDLPFVPLGNSDKMRVGDWVLAIGNPFGLGGSVTAGIISARGRNINSGPYDDFIQTDASINRGNSGGPLFNMQGEVIGINTAIFSPTGGSIGIGFSIPSKVATGVIDQLIKFGKTRRGWLGVRIQKVTPEIADSIGLEKAEGALVASVSAGSPAEKGKIKVGDVILQFNGQAVKEMRNLPKIVAGTEIDKEVTVLVWRNGKMVEVKISVGELEEEQIAKKEIVKPITPVKEKQLKIESLGLRLGDFSPQIGKRFKLKDIDKGVVVVGVETGSPAFEQGIRDGDIIIELGQVGVNTIAEVKTQLKDIKSRGRKTVLLLIKNISGLRFVALKFIAE